uniref:protein FAM102B-like isoform X1 n=1 Tax=Styela clava TaxID=7725 RepID=UPI001939EAB2|nr:protein FAM102B-like isoform X1 [Styela clava]
MSFLRPMRMTKKRYKFQVTLHLEELCSVPFVTGTIYCKVRLRDGGSFTDNTKRADVQDHSVTWKSKFQFQCKMSADPTTGVLESCTLRISVRKELKGGKASAKVGLVDLNLAEFAGSNHTPRHCLLEAYQDKNRLDNSLLKVIVGMHLLSGDPCFKIPTVRDIPLPLPEDLSQREHVRDGSESSGFGSLPRKIAKGHHGRHQEVFEPGHSRNASSTSQQSKLSDYGSRHSRTPSSTSQASSPGVEQQLHYSLSPSKTKTDASTTDSSNFVKTAPPRPPPPKSSLYHPLDISQDRMGVTRVSADDIINKLMEDQDFTHNTSADEEDGLRLYVSSDGKTALGGQSFYNRGGTSMFQPVVINPDTQTNYKPISENSTNR